VRLKIPALGNGEVTSFVANSLIDRGIEVVCLRELPESIIILEQEKFDLANANWENSEWEIAAPGERVLRTVELAKAESEKLRVDGEKLDRSIEELRQEWQFKNIFETENNV
jgi:hypothetical protein